MELGIDIDGKPRDVHLVQVPNVSAGFLVSGESNPEPFDHNGQQWWAVDIVTTPGMTSLIGHTELGAFHITSDLPAEQLAEIIDSLTPTPVSQLPDPRHPTDTAVPDGETDSDHTIDTFAVDGVSEGTAAPAATCGTLGIGLELADR